jgi:hypothetical protein
MLGYELGALSEYEVFAAAVLQSPLLYLNVSRTNQIACERRDD